MRAFLTYPMVLIATAITVGIFVADILTEWFELCLSDAVVVVVGLLPLLYWAHRRHRYGSNLFQVCVFLVAAVAGSALYLLKHDSMKCLATEGATSVTGSVEDLPRKTKRSLPVIVKTDDGQRLVVYLGTRPAEPVISIGDTLTGITRKGVRRTEHGYLFYQGIAGYAYFAPGNWELRRRTEDSGGLMEWLRSRREASADFYRDEGGFRGEELEMLKSLTLGERSGLPSDVKDSYARSGLGHVLALSGFHLMLLYGVLSVVFLEHLVLRRWRFIPRLLIFACIWLFVVFAGAPVSLVRAAIMCSLMLAARQMGLRVISINSIAVAAVLILCADPFQLFNVGFQLSFVSVIAICTVALPVMAAIGVGKRIERETIAAVALGKVYDYVASAMVLSVVCSLATAPLVAYHFHRVPLLTLISNLPVLLLVSVLMYLVVVWWCVGIWKWLSYIIAECLKAIIGLMNHTADWFASISFATVDWAPGAVEVLLSYVCLGLIARLSVRGLDRLK